MVLGTGGPDTAEIAHEALIREWARLATWVEEDADFQQWLAVVEERATEADLLSAARLAEADRWLGERAADIPRRWSASSSAAARRSPRSSARSRCSAPRRS
ncbi:histidine kinase [Streptomyces alboflavus]|uniref:Histidine kinase n=1 Tax=Streptomyces alboflavus TaxID=67267 RepID=A0A1Z1WQB6_9ACTN|nr:hypothetical protein [Streptomyces alboflavus]ARX88512.1 histidine kinase [Streptomyces alboflavus]